MKNSTGKRFMLVLLACLFLVSTALTGCGSTPSNEGTSSAASSAAPSSSEAEATAPEAVPAIDHSQPLSLDIYDNAANYQGEQTGWYAKLLKDKFNLTLNILAPQVAGDQLYKTRSASGNLGDICIIDNSQLEECIPAGLVQDMTDLIKNTTYLSKYVDKHYKPFNAAFEKANPDGKIYGLPTYMADTSPTAFAENLAYSSPILPWDYYQGIGAPEMKNLSDLLSVLDQLHKKYPKTPDGKTIVPITLWKDWDTWEMENVRWLCNWYGYQQPEGTGSVLLGAEGDIVPFSDDNGMYKRILKFFYDANQMGLVDPDSASQDWNKVADKLTNKQVLLLWYQWQRGFYNTIERGKNLDGHVFIPIADLKIFQESDAYFGSGRVFSLGSKAKDVPRIMEFLDWYASPEGINYTVNGIEGFNYEIVDGKIKFTETGKTAFQNNTPVPAEWGGGGYKDGQSAINTMILSVVNTDPGTGELYDNNYWSSTVAENQTALTIAWQEKYGATKPMEYLTKNNMVAVRPSINTSLGTDTSDIKNKRSQCSEIIKNTSWRMIFAKSETDFNSLWDKMKSDLDGLGYKDVVAVDTERCNKIVKLRNDAMGK